MLAKEKDEAGLTPQTVMLGVFLGRALSAASIYHHMVREMKEQGFPDEVIANVEVVAVGTATIVSDFAGTLALVLQESGVDLDVEVPKWQN